MKAILILATVGLAGCTQSIEEVRSSESTPRTVVEGSNFDAFVGCIGSATSKRNLRYTPTEQGGSFIFSTHGLAGTSSMLVDVHRTSPPRAEVRFTGGPWVGQDDALVREVQSCAGK